MSRRTGSSIAAFERWSAAERLLIAASLGEADEARQAWTALRPDFDYDGLTGDWYRLAPLLGWNLERAGLQPDRDPVLARLLGLTRRTWIQSHRHLAALGDLAALLDGGGIRPVVLKGAALLRLAYPEAGLRPMEDIDVLIPVADRDRARPVLEGAGYLLVHQARTGHAEAWTLPGGIELDLHVQANPWLTQPVGGAGLAELHRGAVEIDLPGGDRVRAASAADQLLVVLIHGVRPGSARLRWVADAVWLVRGGRVDWDRFAAQAGRFAGTGLAVRAMELVEAAVGGPVFADDVMDHLRAQRPSVADRLTLAAMDHQRFPNVGRAVLHRVRGLPPGERLRATPAVTADWLGAPSVPAASVALVRRVPAYLRGPKSASPAEGRPATVVSRSRRVLVTGSRGTVGRRVADLLEAHGHEVVGVDLSDGVDLRRPRQVEASVAGCDAVVHLATVSWNSSWRSSIAANVWATGLLLRAARRHGVDRVAYMSTLQVTGSFMGRKPPVRLPFDEHHPTRPETPYAVTKLWAERLLARATRRDRSLVGVSVRAPAIWEDDRFVRDREKWEADETRQWRPFWEYGAFIDVRDLADLLVRAVEQDLAPGHEVLTVSGPDSASRWPTGDLVARLHPTVPWRSGRDREAVRREPFHPLVDSSRAEVLLGWRPTRPFHGHQPEAQSVGPVEAES